VTQQVPCGFLPRWLAEVSRARGLTLAAPTQKHQQYPAKSTRGLQKIALLHLSSGAIASNAKRYLEVISSALLETKIQKTIP
jgi:hypothetical protein